MARSKWRKSHRLFVFRKCLQAFGADFHAPGNAIFGDGHFLDVGLPLTISGLL